MAIGTPTSLGAGSSSTGTTVTFTGSGTIPAGALAFVMLGLGNMTATSVSDGVNSYTKAVTRNSTSAVTAELWYCASASTVTNPTYSIALPSSASIAVHGGYCAGVAGSSPLDVTNTGAGSGTVAGASVATGALATANELIIGFCSVNTTTAGFAQASGFTTLNDITATLASHAATDVVASASTVTYAPTWTSETATYAAVVAAFKGTTSYTLSLSPGSYTLTGKAAIVGRLFTLSLAAGSYALSGKAATFINGIAYRLSCAAGSYVLTGKALIQDYFPGATSLIRKTKFVLQKLRSTPPTLDQ